MIGTIGICPRRVGTEGVPAADWRGKGGLHGRGDTWNAEHSYFKRPKPGARAFHVCELHGEETKLRTESNTQI